MTARALALPLLSSPSQLKESDSALPAVSTADHALTLLPALLVPPPSPSPLIDNVSAQQETSSILLETVCLVPQDARPALTTLSALDALSPSFFRVAYVRPPVMLVSPLWVQSVEVVPLAASSAPRTSSASTALTTFTCTRVSATMCAPLVLSEIAPSPTGSVFLLSLIHI